MYIDQKYPAIVIDAEEDIKAFLSLQERAVFRGGVVYQDEDGGLPSFSEPVKMTPTKLLVFTYGPMVVEFADGLSADYISDRWGVEDHHLDRMTSFCTAVPEAHLHIQKRILSLQEQDASANIKRLRKALADATKFHKRLRTFRAEFSKKESL